MLLLRYQRQMAEEGGGNRQPSGHDMRRKVNNYDLKSESRKSATRGTLICIFICGSLLLILGLTVLFVGLLVEGPRKDPTPWLVIGPTCIVLGILVLLLSIEIILKLRKISSSSRGDSEDSPVPSKKRQSWAGGDEDSSDEKLEKTQMVPKLIPVVVHPPTPMQTLDAATLTGNVVQHR